MQEALTNSLKHGRPRTVNVVVDDQVLVRGGFHMILEASEDIAVVGEAADGGEAIRVVERTRPDVVLMDIRMPDLDGTEATRRLVATGCDARRRAGLFTVASERNSLLAISAFDSPAASSRTIKRGARFMVRKSIQCPKREGLMAAPTLLWQRLAALSGAVSATLIGAGAILGDPYDAATDPNPNQPAAALATALAQNRADARLGAYLVLIGVFLLFWFLAYLHRRLRQAEGEQGWLASVALGGGLVAASVFLLGASVGFASSEVSSYGTDTQVAKTFFVWGWNAANIAAPPMIALVAATTLVGLQFAVFPAWFRWFGVAWTALLVLSLFANMAGMGTALSLAWVLLVSLVLVVKPSARASGFSQAGLSVP